VYRGEFDPHGQALLETGSALLNSHKYTGYERDQATGLDYANARMYTSNTGRFTSPDPAGLKAASRKKPQSLNRYTYVANDPVNHYDPSGLLTLIIGGFNNAEDPDWARPGSPFWLAIRDTFGEEPRLFPWSGRGVTALTLYHGIIQAGRDLINFINNVYQFKSGERLNIVAFSDGGNVVKVASRGINRRIDHLVTLGAPQNFDLPSIDTSAVDNYCNVSSLADPIQFAGSSPGQIYLTGLFAYYGRRAAGDAFEALLNGDFIGAAILSAVADGFFALSAAWYLSTKLDPRANNVLLGSESHFDLHTVPVWNRIKGDCGLSAISPPSRQWPIGSPVRRSR
jgi:RHS repeat-associated protein